MTAVRVLIADSSSDTSAFVRSALANQGYRLLTAASVEETSRLLADEEVHLLLLAASLDGADGCALCRRLRGERRQLPLQVLVMLASPKSADVVRALDAGADDCFRMPCDEGELNARVRAAVARWQAQAGLVEEREFYRLAAAKEEQLSSLVLDQHQSLKDAYEKIQQLNGELEKANRELEQLAAYDTLSGLLNRRTLFSRIGVEIERATRTDVPLTGLMVDIDRFKGINDNFGHPCGDLVIRDIGAKLRSRLRKYDFAGRYGGEEFFVLLYSSTEVQAERIGDRFRREMAATRFTCDASSFSVTVSIGVARFREGDTRESWIERADRALYQAKGAGRNRVVIA